jgi:cation/acetate symporter
MMTVALIFCALAALLHVYIFVMESLTWTSPRTRAVFGTTAEEAQTTKMLAFNQGFYNLFLAVVTVVGIAAIGVFYVLTLFLGLGAMTSGALDPTDTNMAAPLLAKSFSNTLFAVISAIAFTTVLGTVSGLIMAGSGAVAHDLVENVFGVRMNDHEKIRVGKLAAVGLGIVAMVLGILFRNFNVSFLVGWAFNIAASANLPALVMLLFWPRTTRQGIIAAVTVGMLASLAWILLSADTFEKVYGISRDLALTPFSQPGLVTIPLGFLVLIVVSLLTPPPVTPSASRR